MSSELFGILMLQKSSNVGGTNEINFTEKLQLVILYSMAPKKNCISNLSRQCLDKLLKNEFLSKLRLNSRVTPMGKKKGG